MPLIGYLFCRLRGWPYIVRILDVYPDALFQNNLVGKNSFIYKGWMLFNRKIYFPANSIVTLGNIMANKVSSYMTADKKVEVLPDWVNTSKFSPIDKNNNWFTKKYFDKDKIIVIYSGNLGLTHDVDTIFSGIEKMVMYDKISFTIIGGGARKDEVILNSKRIKNLRYIPFQPIEDLPYLLASADISIVCLGKGTEGISMPSKLYYSMASGSAILGISDGENDLKYNINSNKCGINIQNGDVVGFKNAIEKLSQEPFLNECKKNSRKSRCRLFSSHRVIPKYITLLDKIFIKRNKK